MKSQLASMLLDLTSLMDPVKGSGFSVSATMMVCEARQCGEKSREVHGSVFAVVGHHAVVLQTKEDLETKKEGGDGKGGGGLGGVA